MKRFKLRVKFSWWRNSGGFLGFWHICRRYHTPHNLWICFWKAYWNLNASPSFQRNSSAHLLANMLQSLTFLRAILACVRVRPHWWKESLNVSLSNSSRVWLSFVISVSALEEFSISYCILPYVEALLHRKPVAVFTNRARLQSLSCRHIRIKWIR